jgi:hypothetical protein
MLEHGSDRAASAGMDSIVRHMNNRSATGGTYSRNSDQPPNSVSLPLYSFKLPDYSFFDSWRGLQPDWSSDETRNELRAWTAGRLRNVQECRGSKA